MANKPENFDEVIQSSREFRISGLVVLPRPDSMAIPGSTSSSE